MTREQENFAEETLEQRMTEAMIEKIKPKYRFYPRPYRKHNHNECPVCQDTGIVVDMKTKKERPCVACTSKREVL